MLVWPLCNGKCKCLIWRMNFSVTPLLFEDETWLDLYGMAIAIQDEVLFVKQASAGVSAMPSKIR